MSWLRQDGQQVDNAPPGPRSTGSPLRTRVCDVPYPRLPQMMIRVLAHGRAASHPVVSR